MQIIEGKSKKWELVMGLEIHAQVHSQTKLFSASPTKFGAEQNTHVSLFDAAMPGMLPVLNEFCVEQAIRTGLGLNAEINLTSFFDRKNYFYPDLPQGYQISQFMVPIVQNGSLSIDLNVDANGVNKQRKKIRINRIHLEQDAGKSIHDMSPSETFIDLNRSGIALMEIVTEPDLSSQDEVIEFIKQLRSILRYLGTCDGDMEKGSLRCDVNVSVKEVGSKALGTRTEIKNLNSLRYITKAIEYEAKRQVDILESGDNIQQETRLFDVKSGETKLMRSKEEAADYRYFPDPDLLPLTIEQQFVDKIRASLPELPEQKRVRYVEKLGITEYDASVIVVDRSVAEYFESVIAISEDPKLSANWLISELFGRLNKAEISIEDSPVSAQKFGTLIKMIKDDIISGKIAKHVFDVMFETGESPENIVEKEGLKQVTDVSSIESIIDNVLSKNIKEVEAYKAGKTQLLGFFVGQVMKESQGKANPKLLNEILMKKLDLLGNK